MRWIPCKEKMPNEDELVLVSGEQIEYPCVISIGKYVHYWYSRGIINIAWLPLPKPYTADRKTEPFDKDINVRSKTESQTDLLVTEYPQDGEVNLIGRDKTEAVVMAYDTYKELTEPEVDCSWK